MKLDLESDEPWRGIVSPGMAHSEAILMIKMKLNI